MIKSISIIIPFYNEEKRIRRCLNIITRFKKKNNNIEFILVDDGSKDKSNLIVKNFIKKENNIKILTLRKNKGKGYAIKKGIDQAKNEWILTSDVDFSVSLNQIMIWINKKYLNQNCSIYFGSRSHNKSIVKAKIHRILLGKIFRFITRVILKIEINDTQCGYKLYRKNIATKIFKKLKTNRFEHDLEIVLNAKKLNYSITELPVTWTHKSNSKINLFIDPLKMFIGILLLKYKL